jgi:tripartite-type tricarboxylate transporter receptor subunit TctC
MFPKSSVRPPALSTGRAEPARARRGLLPSLPVPTVRAARARAAPPREETTMAHDGRRRAWLRAGAAAAAGVGFAPGGARGADWPARPVRMVVGFPPGGGADAVARMLAERFAELWGQSVVVDNRPGASTMIASEAVARAAPDGHTLLLAVSNHTSNPALFAKVPYDTRADFTPISVVASAPLLLVVNPKVPASSLRELLTLARASPGKLSYASAGNGSVGHLAGELLKQQAGVDMVHVSYKGTGPAEVDLMAGTFDLMFTGMVTAVPQVKAGRMRPIAIGSLRRSQALPEVPTVEEAGVAGFEAGIWYGLLGPGGLPAAIVERIHRDVVRTVQDPAVRTRLTNQGAEAIAGSPAEFRRQIDAEIARNDRLVKSAGIKSE